MPSTEYSQCKTTAFQQNFLRTASMAVAYFAIHAANKEM